MNALPCKVCFETSRMKGAWGRGGVLIWKGGAGIRLLVVRATLSSVGDAYLGLVLCTAVILLVCKIIVDGSRDRRVLQKLL